MTRCDGRIIGGLWVLISLLACTGHPQSSKTLASLDGVDQQSFDEIFAEAVCACEARVYADGYSLRLSRLSVPDTDTVLMNFAENRSCDPVPPRVTRLTAEPNTSGCVSGGFRPPSSIPDGQPGPYAAGFCRGELNHCIANELRLRAESLAEAPRSRAVRDAVLIESRRRFQTAAIETTAAYSYLVDNCDRSVPLPPTLEYECEKLSDSDSLFPQHALGLVADATTQTADLSEQEALNAAATGEALSPGLADSERAFADALWGSESARWLAAQAVMGDAESAAYGPVGGSDDVRDAEYPTVVEPDQRAQVALELLVAFEVPLGIIVDGSTHVVLDPHHPEDGPGAPVERRRFIEARFNLLDHRIAAQYGVDEYSLTGVGDEVFAVEANSAVIAFPADAMQRHDASTLAEFESYAANSLPVELSPLRTTYGLSEADIDRGLSLAANILRTMETAYVLKDQVLLPDGRSLATARLELVQQRPTQRLAGALQNLYPIPGEGSLSAIAPDPLFLTGSTESTSAAGRVGNHYALDGTQAARMGGALATHVLSVNLRRLRNSPRGGTYGVESDVLDAAIELAESYVGSRFFMTTKFFDSGCDCVDSPLFPCTVPSDGSGYIDCSLYWPLASGDGFSRDPLPADTTRWMAFFQAGDEALSDESAFPAIVRSREEAFCLIHGRQPDGSTPDCLAIPTVLPSYLPLVQIRDADVDRRGRPSVTGSLGLQTRRFDIPNAGAFDEATPDHSSSATAYVFWVRSVGGNLTFELLDVVQPRLPGAVHVFGGRFGELFGEIVAKQPLNPGRPALTSLGLAADFVPPLENELTSDGDLFEDSYQVYLNNAAASAANAEALLTEARNFEYDVMLNEARDAALLEEAALSEVEVLSSTCGDLEGCELERVEAITLGSITVEGEPFVTILDPSEIEFWAVGTPAADPGVRFQPQDKVPVSFKRCGDHMAEFTTDFSLASLGSGEDDRRAWGTYMESYLASGISCARYVLRNAAAEALLHDVPVVVLQELARGGPGEFADFSGEIREPLIRLHQSLLDLREALRGFEATYQVALSELRQAKSQMDEAIPSKRRAAMCRLGRALAIIGTVVAAVATTVVTFGAGAAALVVVAAVIAASAATTGAVAGVVSADSCAGEDEVATQIVERTFAGAILALTNLQGLADDIRRTAGQVALGDSQLDRLQRRAEIAKQRRIVAEHIIDSNVIADIPEWRALQNFRVRRARNALSRAQRYAFVARRAVEFRLVEDLPYLMRAETFTEPPTSWANDLFIVDTETTASDDPSDMTTTHSNVAGEAIVDYVEKLSDFVRGYPFSRRFRDATDAQALSIRNMGRDTFGPDETSTPFYTRLGYKCRDLDATILVADGGIPCDGLGGVEYAEARFSIPARFDGYLADRLAVGNFNYRHERTALNMVGAAFVDCRYAARPTECYGDGNVRYDMRQEGRVMLDAFDYDKRIYEMEPGVMVGARALAAERFLTNPLSSTDVGLIGPFERPELWGRPLRGVYTIRIEGRQEYQWRNLDDIQMLLRYRYWTRQD